MNPQVFYQTWSKRGTHKTHPLSISCLQAAAQHYEAQLSRAKSEMEALEKQSCILEKRREEEMGRQMEQANENKATLEAKVAEVC